MEVKGIYHLYLHQFIRGLAFSLVGIFIPIYLLTLGYSLTTVLIYFLVFHTLTFIFTPIALLLSKKIGYKILIIASAVFVVLFLFFLNKLEQLDIPVLLIAAIAGIENALYFIPMHAFFTRLTENQMRGRQFGLLTTIGQVSGLLGPLVGALVATFFGFSYLFYITIFFILISVIPLFYLENIKPNTKLKLRRLPHLTKKNKIFFLGTILDNVRGETEGLIWPIFIFFSLQSLISVGWISFLVGCGTILFTLLLGHFHDKKDKYFFLRLGAVLYALIWAGRIYIDAPIFLYVFSLLAGFCALMIAIPYNAIFYDKAAEKKDPDEFILFIEIPNFIGRAFLWILMIILVDKFVVAFVLAGIASLIFAFFKFEPLKNENEI